MSHPDRENTMTLLTEWKQHHAAIEKLMDGIKQHMGLDPDGTMFVTVWALFGAYTDTLAVEVGDYCGWLDWYRFETEMGAKNMSAGYDGKTKRVKTLANLYGLIAESRKRKPT